MHRFCLPWIKLLSFWCYYWSYQYVITRSCVVGSTSHTYLSAFTLGFLCEVEPTTQLLIGSEFFQTIFFTGKKETSTKTSPKSLFPCGKRQKLSGLVADHHAYRFACLGWSPTTTHTVLSGLVADHHAYRFVWAGRRPPRIPFCLGWSPTTTHTVLPSRSQSLL